MRTDLDPRDDRRAGPDRDDLAPLPSLTLTLVFINRLGDPDRLPDPIRRHPA